MATHAGAGRGIESPAISIQDFEMRASALAGKFETGIEGATYTSMDYAARLTEPSEDWTLSLYRGGGTFLRTNHPTLDICMSAGGSHIADDSAGRFDCGLNCEDSIDLTRAIMCERVCNTGGCRN